MHVSDISRLVLSIAVSSSQNRSYLEPKAEDENDDEDEDDWGRKQGGKAKQ